jgi:DNA-binding MarR family transcriptional regulator
VALSVASTVAAQTDGLESPVLPDDEQSSGDVIPPPEQPDAQDEIDEISKSLPGGEGPSNPAPGPGNGFDDIGRDVAGAVSENWLITGAVAVAAAGVGLLAFFFVNRYVDPRKALENPHRSMLYGFVKGNPGVHLKQLSSEFEMKTSTVLWHVRKLECANLVRSKKANGYRVFYPVSGGLEAKQLSTAITALSNTNARNIFEFVALAPGSQQRNIASKLVINPGTVRWHLKKLTTAGLMAELIKDRTGFFYATELGIKAMRQVAGLPPDVKAPALDLPEADASRVSV